MLLQGKHCLVTGASKGIGREVCSLFAEQGATVTAVSRNREALDSLMESIPNPSGRNSHYVVDVTDPEGIKAFFKKLSEGGVEVDCLVNNAGIMEDATLQMVKQETIDRIYRTNVYGIINMSQLAMRSMIRKRGGSIINLTSIIGTNGNSGQTVYGSSKAAVIGFTKSLSKELAPLNIRVNAIAPGFIDTDMTRGMDEKFYEKNLSRIGMRRIGKPVDVAKVALFLASDLSAYVTGQVIGVDGGMII